MTHKLKISSIALTLLLTLSLSAYAGPVGFSGAYDPANWTLTNTGDSDGSVDTSGAPSSITLIGGDSGEDGSGLTSFTIVALVSGMVSFDWAYYTDDVDGPLYDPAGYLINGTRYQLSDDSGVDSQSGFGSFAVNAGDDFGFYVYSTDNSLGAASITISNLDVGQVPEPATFGMLGIGLLGVALISRHRRKD